MRVALFLCCLTLLLCLEVVDPVFAQSPKVEVEVDHVAGDFEKLNEKIALFFRFSKEDKYKYQKFLVEKRLAELKYIVDSKDWDPVEVTSSRYATYLGNFNNFILENKLGNKKNELISMYERHSRILEELKRNFERDSGWWILLQHDINSTRIFSEQLNKTFPPN